MAHRAKKYASQYKQDKINNLAFAGPEGRKAIIAQATNSQWHRRVSKNARGFWKPSPAA